MNLLWANNFVELVESEKYLTCRIKGQPKSTEKNKK